MKRRSIMLLLIAAAICSGALREFLFLNLNYQLDHVQRGTSFSYAHSVFQSWVHDRGYEELIGMKWTLAAFFILVMTGASVFAARILFTSRRYDIPIVIGSALIAALSFLCYAASSIFPGLEHVGVRLLHAIQYPVVILFLWLASPLVKDRP